HADIVSSLLLPRPPSPTLFPYTTLFRSDHTGERKAAGTNGDADLADGLEAGVAFRTTNRLSGIGVLHLKMSATGTGQGQCHVQKDRKSTRLNSSHVSISYAVFCLKKKKR